VTIVKKIALFLVLISLSATGVMYLLEPIEDLEASLGVFGNKLICQEEIKGIITNRFKNKQKFIQYNPINFAKALKDHPLIKSAVVRTNIFPEKQFTVLINEEEPWAFYRNRIYNTDFKVIKNFDLETVEEDFDSVFDLHSAILNKESSIITINSNKELKKKELTKLKKICNKVNLRLEMVEITPIKEVKIIDGNLTLVSSDLNLIFGTYMKKFKSKLKKLDFMLANIKEKLNEIDYIDFSMNTNEAIIGKRL
jgi:hypothetical protein